MRERHGQALRFALVTIGLLVSLASFSAAHAQWGDANNDPFGGSSDVPWETSPGSNDLFGEPDDDPWDILPGNDDLFGEPDDDPWDILPGNDDLFGEPDDDPWDILPDNDFGGSNDGLWDPLPDNVTGPQSCHDQSVRMPCNDTDLWDDQPWWATDEEWRSECTDAHIWSTCDPWTEYALDNCELLFGRGECESVNPDECEGRYGMSGCANAGLAYTNEVRCDHVKGATNKLLASCSSNGVLGVDMGDCLEGTSLGAGPGERVFYCKSSSETSALSSLRTVEVIDVSTHLPSSGAAVYCDGLQPLGPSCDAFSSKLVDYETCEQDLRMPKPSGFYGTWYTCEAY